MKIQRSDEWILAMFAATTSPKKAAKKMNSTNKQYATGTGLAKFFCIIFPSDFIFCLCHIIHLNKVDSIN